MMKRPEKPKFSPIRPYSIANFKVINRYAKRTITNSSIT